MIFSYSEYVKKYHSDIAGATTLENEWLKEEMCKYGLNYVDFDTEIFGVLDQFRMIEKEACIVMKNGNDISSWLYSLIRPDFDEDDKSYSYIVAVQKLYDFYIQSCIAREIIQSSLSSVKGIFPKGDRDNPDSIDNNFVNNESNDIENETGVNEHKYQINTHISSSVQKTLLQQYSKKMQLDVSYSMNASEMSVCAMDDIAYHLSKNAVLMGTGSLALSAGMCLGQSYIGSRNLGLDNKIITETLLRPGAKSSLRVALIGALKIGATRDALPIISGVASSAALLGVATVGVECCDAMVQYAQRRIDAWQAIDQVGRASTTGICSLMLGAQGAAIGTSAAVGMVSVVPLMAPILGSTIAIPLMGEVIGSGAGMFVGSLVGKEVYERTRRLAVISENMVGDAIKAEELWEQSRVVVRRLHNKIKAARVELQI